MITFFCTPKPFRGYIAMIQRNALQSWKQLGLDIEVIVFGNEEGAAEVCREYGLRHEPHVERTASGSKYVAHLFEAAQRTARHDLLCYSNCDIILLRSFRTCVERLAAWQRPFLMVGRRWDLDVREPVPFHLPDWQERLLQEVVQNAHRIPAYNIDYFAFPRGLYRDIPPLVLGRIWWDQWLLWRASSGGVPVVDASSLVYAVHQNHDYSYHPQGKSGVFADEEADRNFQFAGGWKHLHTIADASHRITQQGIQRNDWGKLAPLGRTVVRPLRRLRAWVRSALWHPFLKWSAPVRHAVGLRQGLLVRPMQALKLKRAMSKRYLP